MANNKPIITVETPLVISHGERIATLTESQKAMEHAITALTHNVNKMGETIQLELQGNREATHREIASVKDMVAAIKTPNYATWIAGAVAIGSLIYALLNPIHTQVAEIKAGDTKLSDQLSRHEQFDIHPVARKWLEGEILLRNEQQSENNRRFGELEARLERRMAQEQELMLTRVNAQREILELKDKIVELNGRLEHKPKE